VLVSTTSTGRLFHRAGAATENARLASSVDASRDSAGWPRRSKVLGEAEYARWIRF